MAERWLPVIDFEGVYEVSDHGRVRNRHGLVLAGTLHPKGYLLVSLSRRPLRPKPWRVHRLVANHFIPNPLGLAEVNHRDLNKMNNRAENLEWISHADNIEHARLNGHFDPTKHSGRLKRFTQDQVEHMLLMLHRGATLTECAKFFGTDTTHVWRIRDGHSWKSLNRDFNNR